MTSCWFLSLSFNKVSSSHFFISCLCQKHSPGCPAAVCKAMWGGCEAMWGLGYPSWLPLPAFLATDFRHTCEPRGTERTCHPRLTLVTNPQSCVPNKWQLFSQPSSGVVAIKTKGCLLQRCCHLVRWRLCAELGSNYFEQESKFLEGKPLSLFLLTTRAPPQSRARHSG